jgi:hypothetical protein
MPTKQKHERVSTPLLVDKKERKRLDRITVPLAAFSLALPVALAAVKKTDLGTPLLVAAIACMFALPFLLTYLSARIIEELT